MRGMTQTEAKDFQEVLQAFSSCHDQVLSPWSVASSLSPSPTPTPTPMCSMDMLSQFGFDDLLGNDEVCQALPPSRSPPPVTPRKPTDLVPGITPPSKFPMPFGQRPFGMSIKKGIEADEKDDEQERQVEEKDDEQVDEADDEQDDEQDGEDDDSSGDDEDSICVEARAFASKTSQTMTTGWMKTQVKKSIKAHQKHKKEETEAKQAAAKAARAADISLAKKKGKKQSKGKEVKKTVISKSSKGKKGVINHCNSPRSTHDLTAVITKTVLRQAHKQRPRTYMQGYTADMTEATKRFILITEITESQSPNHHALMQEVTY